MLVIPAINCHMGDEECVKARLAVMHSLPGAKWAHLDAADGRFTMNRTWASPGQWKKIGAGTKLEVHLMDEEPLSKAAEWMEAGAARLIVHVETVNRKELAELVHAANGRGVSVALAFSPETEIKDAEDMLHLVKEYLVLGVHPGLAGQKFLPLVSGKIYELKSKSPHAWVEVDGGMKPEVAQSVKKIGADAIVAASYIFGGPDPARAYAELTAI